jgi:hypothetical protein
MNTSTWMAICTGAIWAILFALLEWREKAGKPGRAWLVIKSAASAFVIMFLFAKGCAMVQPPAREELECAPTGPAIYNDC